MATVQLPTAWRPLFLDGTNVELFFRLFDGLQPPQGAAAGAPPGLAIAAPQLRALVRLLLHLFI